MNLMKISVEKNLKLHLFIKNLSELEVKTFEDLGVTGGRFF